MEAPRPVKVEEREGAGGRPPSGGGAVATTADPTLPLHAWKRGFGDIPDMYV
jgi:hypothetical protein